MNILALTAYFAPEQYASSHLTDNYCEAFAQSGFEMYIYTPCPTRGINDEEREKYKKHLKYESLNDGKLHVYRFPLMREGKSPIKRALRYFLECFKHYFIMDVKTRMQTFCLLLVLLQYKELWRL